MSKTRLASVDILRHIFLDVPPPWLGYLEISLHTALPGNGQTDFEISYEGYSRVKLLRNRSNWIVEGTESRNANPIHFPICTGGDQTATHVGIGCAGTLIHVAELDEVIKITRRVQPVIPAGELVASES